MNENISLNKEPSPSKELFSKGLDGNTSSRATIQKKKHLTRPPRLKGKVHYTRVKKNK